jgi:hypothetical protein
MNFSDFCRLAISTLLVLDNSKLTKHVVYNFNENLVSVAKINLSWNVL